MNARVSASALAMIVSMFPGIECSARDGAASAEVSACRVRCPPERPNRIRISLPVDGRLLTATVQTAVDAVDTIAANTAGQAVIIGTTKSGSSRLSVVDLRTRRVIDETPTLSAKIHPSGNFAAYLDFEGLHPSRVNGSRRIVVIRDTRTSGDAIRSLKPVISIDVAEAFADAYRKTVASTPVSVTADGLDWSSDGGLTVELGVFDVKDPSRMIGHGRLVIVPDWRSHSVAIEAVNFIRTD